jgi:tRNA pseudouridine32 synthase / 23S rRNA pseudouridine746 synthase
LNNAPPRSRVVLPTQPKSGLNAPAPWPDLLGFLVARFVHVTRSEWLRRFESGLVWGADGKPLRADHTCTPGLVVHYQRHVANEAPIAAQERIVFEDERIVVADKPHGLPVVPSGRYMAHTLLTRLQQRLALPNLAPVHRLDKDTAGLVLFTKSPEHRDTYHALFRNRQVRKIYEAIAPDLPHLSFPLERRSRLVRGEHFMHTVEAPGMANAITQIDKIEALGAWARYRLQPITGQRHQLRVHMAALGAPLWGDAIYPQLLPLTDTSLAHEPLRLLAQELAFIDPHSGRTQCFRSAVVLHWPQTVAV